MASSEDDLAFLSPSFDPASLTMPRLRNILMAHEISYPASAKKPQLVDIFTQVLKPRAPEILAAHNRVRRTSRGITDMPSSQEGTLDGDIYDDTSSMKPPRVPDTPRQRKTRKSTRQSVEPAMSTSAATTIIPNDIKSSSKHARPSDTEPDSEQTRPSMRKSRKSDTLSVVKIENSEDKPIPPSTRSGVFSDENPFQSGSSPLSSEENRRKRGRKSSDKRKSSSNRRRTEGAPSPPRQQDGILVPTSTTFTLPVSRLKQSASENELSDGIEAGEEFTADEQLNLVRERAANGEVGILPPRKRKRPHQSRVIPRSAPWVVLMALLVGYAIWWRQEKLAVGYCGVGRPSYALSSVQTPEWAEALQPTCEPCPPHAICYQGMEIKCENDFLLKPHQLSFGGLVPLPPSCEPDGEKARRVKVVADRAVEELRERKGQAECGILKDSKGKDVSAVIKEESLKQEVGKKRRRNMDAAEFEDLWKGAIGEILGREEVIASSDGTHLHLSSTSLANIPLSCTIKRSARLTLARYRFSISIVTLSGIAFLYIRSRVLTSRGDIARVPSLVATTLDRLATQAALHAKGDAVESWISVGQLRDDVLRCEFSDQRRERVWKRVRAVVERNANVRASVREGRGGDVSRVWEWVGSVRVLEEGALSGGANKRVSFGPVVEGREGQEMVEKRQWNEGRPVY